MSASLETETEGLRQAYAALNRGDIDGFVKDFDPQIDRVEFEGSSMAGAFHGINDVKAHVAQGRSTWAEGTCEPQRFIASGDTVVVSCHFPRQAKRPNRLARRPHHRRLHISRGQGHRVQHLR